MTIGVSNYRGLKSSFKLLLGLLLCAVSASAAFAQADEDAVAKQTALTVKFLIGDAVSLSNQKYTEVEDAIQRLRNRDGEGAMNLLERAKEKYPKLPPPTMMMAKMQLLARNNQAVQVLLERTVQNHPDDPEAYLFLGDQAFRGNRTTEADALFKMAEPLVKKFSGNTKRKRYFETRLLSGLSAVSERRAQWDKAYKLLVKWAEVDEDSASAQNRLAITLYHLGKPKEAYAAFVKARELDSKLAHPYVSLGQLLMQDGEDEKARKSFERAYNEEKDNVNTSEAYVNWLISQENFSEAQKIAAEMRKQTDDSIRSLILDGVVSYMKADTKRAEQAFQKILSLEPRHAKATDLLALLLIESDKVSDQERALSYAELNAERFPENAQANITKAWVLYKLGRKADAQKSLQIGAQGGKAQADTWYLIAKIMYSEKQLDKAQAALEQAMAKKAGLFIFRKEAEELMLKIKSETGG